MVRERRGWNLDKIKDLLTEAEQRSITRIQISSEGDDDKMVWPHNREGFYTVKIGEFPETIENTLLLCGWVLPLWFGVARIRINRDQIRTLVEWLMTVLRDSGKGKEQQLHLGSVIAVISWFIWKACCQHVFEKAELRPETIVPIIQRFILEIEDANSLTRSKKTTAEVRIKEDKWKAPDEGCSKLNCDGAIDTQTFDDGIGIIVGNSAADLIGGKGLSLQVSSIEEAEVVAIRNSLELVEQMKLQKVPLFQFGVGHINSTVVKKTLAFIGVFWVASNRQKVGWKWVRLESGVEMDKVAQNC
ncbi:hypothetical protein COLO4_04666 [Corchorus olitorius]|uniref:RNase H type-1 domain-containing protein n=1 Tax=Corchorus olitorius TaxID=93759 RepID=A0A1R3KT93_9ROSI|nr:hypothetical protein COLO4_04666 [Corchorus olitorius]